MPIRDRKPGRRPAAPLLVGLVVGALGGLLVAPAPSLVPFSAASATAVPAATPGPSTSGSEAPSGSPPGLPSGSPSPETTIAEPRREAGCAAVVAAMSTADRLAQRLMVGVDASDPAGTVDTVRATQVGGVFIGGNGTALLRDQALSKVQAVSRIPLAVAVDDEGGRVQRLDRLDGELPSARAMAAGLTTQEVYDLGRDRGRALVERGVTMNLAPTVDVGAQPPGAVIGDRSFGADPADVVAYAGAFAVGQREAGVFTVLKHFPGHGRADGDSHKGRVATPPLDELRRDDLEPYAALLGPGGPLAPTPDGNGRTGVMVGHLDVPGLTDDLPTSLTPAVYALLRGEYGFDGLVLTDDLGAMKAVTTSFGLPEAVERALDAGSDVALWSSGGGAAGGRIGPVLDRLTDALATGRLDPQANDTAVERILAAKGTCSRRPA